MFSHGAKLLPDGFLKWGVGGGGVSTTIVWIDQYHDETTQTTHKYEKS